MCILFFLNNKKTGGMNSKQTRNYETLTCRIVARYLESDSE